MEQTHTKIEKKIKSNAWIDHVKAYQTKHACSYKDAMKLSKESYKGIVKTLPSKKEKTNLPSEDLE